MTDMLVVELPKEKQDDEQLIRTTKYFIILEWIEVENIGIVSNQDGTAMLFDSYEEAEKYAKENLNFEWKVVEL